MKYPALIAVIFIVTGGFIACRNAAITAKSEPETIKSIESPPTSEGLKITPTPTPTPEKSEKKAGLAELVKLDGTIKLDIRYATTNNFVGKTIYKEARAFLQRPAAEALVRIHQKLKKDNLGIVIFDGYRPLSATKIFWEVTPAAKKKFVADPKKGSRHNRGCAVDLSLFDLKTGVNLEMPTDFDDFTERAAIDYAGATERQKKNREILRQAMESDGFKVYPAEWWHYDFQDCPETRILDIPFADIK
jgi:zinc D-Ala-D-Ala dipeptidase